MKLDEPRTVPGCDDAPEARYTARLPKAHRRRLGQYFTPPPIAQFMADWIAANPACRSILDPALGLGIFFRALLNRPRAAQYELVGYDLDPSIVESAATLLEIFDHPNVRLINADYLFNDWQTRYDGIICNPPYLKFQEYTNRSASLSELQARLGMKLSGFTNIYTMFLLKSIHQLKKGGRAAYIVPLEFLNADYGATIKRYLLQHGSLRYIVVFDAQKQLFDAALTTSCILLFAHDTHADSVTFINARSVDDLALIATRLGDYPTVTVPGFAVPYTDIDPTLKWRSYYQRHHPHRYKHLVPLATYGKIMRGIATGHNDYFTFGAEKQQTFAIDDRYLLPCITKATHADTAFFTKSDFDDLYRKGKRAFLFDARDGVAPSVQRYIKLGEETDVDTRYLTRHRNPWFKLENRPPAPILATTFHRNELRFIRNEAGVRNLTCFHGFYIRPQLMPRIDLLMAYLLTDIARAIFNDDHREYGGGLKKFEPNDLNRARALDLDVIDARTERMILELYRRYRASVLQRCSADHVLQQLNQLFVQILHD